MGALVAFFSILNLLEGLLVALVAQDLAPADVFLWDFLFQGLISYKVLPACFARYKASTPGTFPWPSEPSRVGSCVGLLIPSTPFMEGGLPCDSTGSKFGSFIASEIAFLSLLGNIPCLILGWSFFSHHLCMASV